MIRFSCEGEGRRGDVHCSGIYKVDVEWCAYLLWKERVVDLRATKKVDPPTSLAFASSVAHSLLIMLLNVDWTEYHFLVALASICFNPIFWNVMARLEYKTHFLTRMWGSPYSGCYFLAVVIFSLGLLRDQLYSFSRIHSLTYLPLSFLSFHIHTLFHSNISMLNYFIKITTKTGFCVWSILLLSFSSYHIALRYQPKFDWNDTVVSIVSTLLIAIGLILVLSSFYRSRSVVSEALFSLSLPPFLITPSFVWTCRLGITGTFLGDYFGILMKEKVTGFPFNLTSDPMYNGSSLIFLGDAIAYVTQ